MRKVLLATTAIVGFAVAGAAQAATSPLTVTVGGSVDFVAGAAHESKASGAVAPSGGDFETIYSLDFGVAGKAANGIEYGGNIVIDNDIDAEDNFVGQGNNIAVSEADVFMSGAFGKVVLGDMRGATDLAVTAPNVGGIRYIDFLGAAAGTAGSFAKDLVIGIDGKDHSTNVTYFTPKVGNDMHKVQLGVTYAPEFNKYGSDVKLTRVAADEYKNVIKGALLYTGTFKPVAVKASANIISGTGESSTTRRSFTGYGVGLEAAAQGFTVGANYADNGRYNSVVGAAKKDQKMVGAGIKYEFNKVAVGFNYLGGDGYSGANFANDYVKEFSNYSLGGTYTWAPGLSTNVNGVLFNQKTDTGVKNDGYVLLLSQKLAF